MDGLHFLNGLSPAGSSTRVPEIEQIRNRKFHTTPLGWLASPSHSLEPSLYLAILSQHHGKYRLDATPGPMARITAYPREHGGRVLFQALINFILPFGFR